MKILVTGGREFRDVGLLDTTLTELHFETKILILIHGGARGADLLADIWAKSNGVQTARCEANWNIYKNKAGPRRNKLMLLLEPDLVVAFAGGPGTANMVKFAKEANIKVMEV